MRILLIGEYSRLHNSLKEGLQKLGHEVVIVGSGDDFKDYPVDINIRQPFTTGFGLFIKKAVYKISRIDLTSKAIKRQVLHLKSQISNYDYVQLINENAFNTMPKVEKELLDHIFNNNKNVFLMSCGADYLSVQFALDKKFKYSILSPYFENKILRRDFWYVLKYSTQIYKGLHDFIFKNIKGIIASDLDYHIPLKNHKKYLGLIPNPINIEKLEFTPLEIKGKIIVFHGVNSKNYIKKGNVFFDEALQQIQHKYPDQVIILRTEDLPYAQYIEAFNKAHIVLDQVYAYDQGYNALEAMAKGKVVFTGAEQEWLDYYNLEENTVAINALPETEALVKKLSWLIENPNKILEISKNARAFIEREHHYITIAKQYLKTWEANSI
ncbi:glycosyltransferase [Hanstruepera marina]|uniref:glycosyltransferase n=1 Tax=Hanstruepera marina TaxID=2873265 RepID=UPI001CA704A6|nr:glycosyltransferase [Hanstruepera marina]